MAKKLDLKLSVQSMQEAINYIEQYKSDLNRGMETFLSRLANAGIEVARATITNVAQEEKGNTFCDIKDLTSNTVTLYMRGDKALFVEFGAGIAFSQPQNPKAAEMGYGLGTYPGQTHAYQEEGWWYTGEDGQSHHSRGNAPYMPMYKAENEVIRNVRQIAREVFGG